MNLPYRPYGMRARRLEFRLSEQELREVHDFISYIRQEGGKISLSELIRNGIRREIAAVNENSQTAKKQADAIALYDAVSQFFPE